MNSQDIVVLYHNAMHDDLSRYEVPDDAVKIAIESMALVYKPDVVSLNSERSIVADYNDVSHRCAYLHKYAAFHTAMVKDMLYEAIRLDLDFYSRWLFSENTFRICSLGGGPGSDVIGALAALGTAFSYFSASATIVDYMFNWSYSFESLLRELGTGRYGQFGMNMRYHLSWNYLQANLLKSLSPEVAHCLGEASLVTMIKFASAAACMDTESMMKKIFAAMKPGAMVLFIDNDGGGFHKIFMDAALKYNFCSVYGPHRHQNYLNEEMRVKRFGYQSCYKTTVTMHILQKPYLGRQYHSPYVGGRRALLQSPTIFSPPTPILFDPFTPSVETNFANDECFNDTDFRSPLQPVFPHSPALLPIPQTPLPLPMSHIGHISHRFSIVNHTPSPIHKRGKYRAQGCFPVKNFRHHLKEKVNKIKSRAVSAIRRRIKTKNKKSHPIFRL